MTKTLFGDESGYTLVETLVAMVIFLTVLIPVGFGVTSYLFDRKAEDLREAMLLAEIQMTTQDWRESGESVHGKYLVKTEIALVGTLVEHRVTVSGIGRPSFPLVVLSKIVELPS